MCKVLNAPAENVLFFPLRQMTEEDPYCLSPLSCIVMLDCVRRILPSEIKMNFIQQQEFVLKNQSQQRCLLPYPGIGENVEFLKRPAPTSYLKYCFEKKIMK